MDHHTSIQSLVHWPLMGGLLRLVHRGGAWESCGPAQSPSRCTKCNSPHINGKCTNFMLFAPVGVPVVTMALFCIIYDIKRGIGRKSRFFIPELRSFHTPAAL